MQKNNILIIKHGALGDFILSFGPFLAIRNFHRNDNLFLLTSKIFKEFALESKYFNEIIVDDRPSFWNLRKIFNLAKFLRKKNFTRVYDLQTSQRSSLYHKFFIGKDIEWSGISYGCSHPDNNSERNKIHTIERHQYQLKEIGIRNVKLSNFSWVKDKKKFKIKKPYVLFSPGASSHRIKKKWPEMNYVKLAKIFIKKGITPVVLGNTEDKKIVDFICMNTNGCINLLNKTEIEDLCVLARNAKLAIGNDTGPMHVFTMNGCNSIVLFSDDSNPIRCAPRAINKRKIVKIIQKNDLRNLTTDEVINSLRNDFGYDL